MGYYKQLDAREHNLYKMDKFFEKQNYFRNQ